MSRRRLWRWRHPIVLLCLILGSLGAVNAGGVTASGQGTFLDKGTYYLDPACGTDQMLFKARIFQNVNFGGESWVFCSNAPDLCDVPFGENSSSAMLCINGYDGDTANDRGSSIKVSAVYGGASCYIEVRDNRNYGGARWVTWDPVNDASWVPWPNDESSSIRRVCT